MQIGKLVMGMLVLLLVLPGALAIEVSIDSVEVMQGEKASVDIMLDSEEEIFGLQMDIIYDSSLLDFVSIEKGDYFRKDGGASLDSNEFGGLIHDAGLIRKFIAMRGFGESEGISGKGVFATIKFVGKNLGQSDIKVSNFVWTDNEANRYDIGVNANVGKVIVKSEGGEKISGEEESLGIGKTNLYLALGVIGILIVVLIVWIMKRIGSN